MKSIATRLSDIKAQIQNLEHKYGREENSVELLAVSKTKPVADIRAVLELEQRHFGENYLQEALEKIQILAGSGAIWHFIGPVQSNKTRAIAEHFHWLHSLERLKIAERLNAARPDALPPLNVCIQVNISQEESKSGVAVDEVSRLAEQISALPKLKLRGLMALPMPKETLEEQRQQCRRLSVLFEQLKKAGYDVDTLSMGTTNDMEAAIAEGSTMVRIGTAIFGARN